MIKRSRENTELLHFHNIIYIRVSLSGTPEGFTHGRRKYLTTSPDISYKRLLLWRLLILGKNYHYYY
jgi:hypothetical protein